METADLRASKNIQYRAESVGKHHKSPQKIWFKRLGAGGPGFESPHSDHLSQKNRLKRRFFCVFYFVFKDRTIAVQQWFKGQKSGGSMSEDSCRNRQIPNPSLIGVTAVFSLWIRQILEFSSLIHYNSSTVSLCATKAAVWVYSHAAYFICNAFKIMSEQ